LDFIIRINSCLLVMLLDTFWTVS